jgi:CO dehydrogenase maturation factor
MCENHAHEHPHQIQPRYARRRAGPRQPALQRPLRIAIVGKGGAGKTTIAGALARTLAARGLRVLAIDADPDANLATVLPLDGAEPPIPLARQHDLLRAAGAGGLPQGLFLLNPDTCRLLPKGTVTWGGGHALVALGWSKTGGEGCYCAEHALLRQLLSQASKATADITLIDSEAGLEHLSRGTIAGVDIALVVIEPGRRSLETAAAIRQLAANLDIAHVHAVVSGCRDSEEEARVLGWLPDWPPLAAFPFDEAVRHGDLVGQAPILGGVFRRAAEALADSLLALPLRKSLDHVQGAKF